MKGLLFLCLELVVEPIFRRLRKKGPPLGKGRLWALAAGANLARLNGASLTSLHNELLPLTSRHILRTWWDVTDGRTLVETIEWLRSTGHRARFAVLHGLLAGGPHAPHVQGVLRDGQFLGNPVVDFVWKNHARFKNGDLVAWDLCRLINVSRYGYSAGYLAEHDAWDGILAAARVLQNEYASWEELSDNYLLGFSYWQDGAQPDRFLVAAASWLKHSAESPWRRLRWSQELG